MFYKTIYGFTFDQSNMILEKVGGSIVQNYIYSDWNDFFLFRIFEFEFN